VEEVSINERAKLAKAPFNLDDYKSDLDINNVWGEKGYSVIERARIRPTLDVNGIWGGYTGEGSKTIIPSKACAKISMRLVPNQDHVKISELFKKHFESIAPNCVKVKVSLHHGGQAYVMHSDSTAYIAAERAIEKTFGCQPIPFRSGGSIPIISTFEQVLGIKSILMGFGLESDNIHSPNENYPLYNFFKGIETIPWFYKYYTETFNR
jgi:acetylornithine deacetylase/succinyl-diaminopimelate desuccinylase-like protein